MICFLILELENMGQLCFKECDSTGVGLEGKCHSGFCGAEGYCCKLGNHKYST